MSSPIRPQDLRLIPRKRSLQCLRELSTGIEGIGQLESCGTPLPPR